jgi:hypothetical protein
MADEPVVAHPGQHREVLRDRVQAVLAQVHQVELIPAELAEVLLDQPAQLVRPG